MKKVINLNNMNLTLGISSCPNDTFMFDAMIHNKIDTENLSFKLNIADIEGLNKQAIENTIDISKISYAVYPYISKNYIILDSGSAIGNNNGPLLISKTKVYPDEIKYLKIAIPGKYTTANLLFSILFPEALTKKEYLFSEIEDVVLSNEMDAGLIIHENRFTYNKKGLQKVNDIGDLWNKQTNLPIPLGAIVISNRFPKELISKVNRVLKASIEYAFANPKSSYEFVKKYAQNIDDNVIRKHIDLYVNNYSTDMGEKGKEAIKTLFQRAIELKIIPEINGKMFIDEL